MRSFTWFHAMQWFLPYLVFAEKDYEKLSNVNLKTTRHIFADGNTVYWMLL